MKKPTPKLLKQLSTLSKEFWDSAREQKEMWKKPQNYNDWQLAQDLEYLSFEESHCGTFDVHGEFSFKQLVRAICRGVKERHRGHFLYLHPVQPSYEDKQKTLVKIGFQSLYPFYHLGYLKRSPDHGLSKFWSLRVTLEDQKRILRLAKNGLPKPGK